MLAVLPGGKGANAAVSHEQLVSSGPLLLIEAAKTAFGPVGYTVLLLSALVATVTCINGGLYGMTSITFALAEKGQLPSRPGQKVRASTRGLTFSAAAALVMINTMDLTTVASLGSATTLVIYFLVNLDAFRLIRDKGLTRVVLPFVACFVSRYSHAGDLLRICEGYWQPTFGKEYLQQGLFSATLEGL